MKQNKKILAVFFSFALMSALMTALLILLHSNHRLESLQDQMLFTASDCCISGLDEGQVKKLVKDPDASLDWHAIEQPEYASYSKKNQSVDLLRGDEEYFTLTCHLEEGRLPKAADEIAAERWALLNIGVEPTCGQTVAIYNRDKGCTEKYRLTGILSDIAANKTYGVKRVYAPLQKKKDAEYSVYIRWKKIDDYKKQADELCRLLGITRKSLSSCPGREDYDELRNIDAVMAGVLLFVGSIIFYGVYRIALIARRKEYGIYRALGMTKSQLRFFILRELYQVFLAGAPVGLACGSGAALFVIGISGDKRQEIYLNNAKVFFSPVIPMPQILCGIVLTALIVGIVGLWAGASVVRQTAPELLLGESAKKKDSGGFLLRESYGRGRTLICLGNKYLLKDKTTSLFVILTICVGTVLFTGLFYQAQSSYLFRTDTKEMHYLNGQYEVGTLRLDAMTDGITRSDLKKIQELDGVERVKYMAGFPVRVIDDVSVKRNDAYYDDMNRRFLKYNDYPLIGNDGTDDVYHSLLYGYNKLALKELKKYVIEGDFEIDGLKEDEIILSILRTDDTKQNKNPGSFREGTPLMDYHAGDRICVKYRKDFDTDSMAYKQMADENGAYAYRTYRIAAVVSFSYMFDCNRTLLPLLITSDSRLKEICPDCHIQQVYLDGDVSSQKAQEKLERKLIQIGSKNPDVSTRSRISDIRKNEMLFARQMVYIFSVAAVTFILVLLNVENNLKYRMQARTREIGMYRSIGMNISMLRKMMLWENGLLGVTGILCGYAAANPLLYCLYSQSSRKAFGHPYEFEYGAFLCIAALVLALCLLLSTLLTNEWRSKRVLVDGLF